MCFVTDISGCERSLVGAPGVVDAWILACKVHLQRRLDLDRPRGRRRIVIKRYARGQIGQEELHVIEMNKLLRIPI